MVESAGEPRAEFRVVDVDADASAGGSLAVIGRCLGAFGAGARFVRVEPGGRAVAFVVAEIRLYGFVIDAATPPQGVRAVLAGADDELRAIRAGDVLHGPAPTL